MTVSSKTTIKTYFETGDFPSQQNFADFIDSCVFQAEMTAQTIQGSLSVVGTLSANTIAAQSFSTGTFSGTTVNVVTLNATNTNSVNVSAASVNSTSINTSTVSAANYAGTPTNNNAATGAIGEFISSNIPFASAIPITNSIAQNITFIPLQAGDYDVWGTVSYSVGGSTNVFSATGAISQVSNTVPASPGNGAFNRWVVPTANPVVGDAPTLPTGTTRIILPASANVFLTTVLAFNTSTASAYGFIGARRAR